VDGEANDAVSIAWKQSPEDNRRELFDMINPFDHKHFVEQAEYFWQVVAKRKCPIQIKAINYSPITYLLYLVVHRAKMDVRKVIAFDLNDADMKKLMDAIGELATLKITIYDTRYFNYDIPKSLGSLTTIKI
jgi:hypothetical protein